MKGHDDTRAVVLRRHPPTLGAALRGDQIKGDSETHPVLSPTDEFADFETWSSWAGQTRDPGDHPCCRQTWGPESMGALKEGEYARSGLKRGLQLEAELGANPFKFGLIGSTDAHTSLATADSDNFWGKYSSTYPSPTRMIEPMGGDLLPPPAAGRAPVFLVGAMKDPDGANLDRVQIVKGWLDAEGTLHERVHEVALSDGRDVGPDGSRAYTSPIWYTP